ncbi:Acetamidase [Ascosphaera atra]|nr:Acetamidase [Ascosphaera atra]
MKAVLSKKPWLGDPLTPPIPWRIDLEEEIKAKAKHGDGKRLAFGILWDDGIVRPQPPVRRALHLVADILKKLDHGVIDWKPPSHRMAHKLAVAAYYLDAANDLKAQMALSNEPTPKPLNSVLNRTAPEKTASEIFSTNREKREYQKKYLDYWNSTASLTGTDEPVDAFIAPVSPFAAARHGGNTYVGYSIAINTLDYSSVVIPVTQANRLLDGLDDDPEYTPLSEEDKAVHDDYDPDIYHGAFVGLQVVGRRYDEEKLIALAEFLTEEINQTHAGPATNSGMAIEPQLESLKV